MTLTITMTMTLTTTMTMTMALTITIASNLITTIIIIKIFLLSAFFTIQSLNQLDVSLFQTLQEVNRK